ncbi:MAG: hypothetical protein ACFCVD_20520 [Nodosilinea sp.]
MVHTDAQIAVTSLPPSSYVVLGVATCYLRQEGETVAVKVIEPVSSAYLEALLKGVPTAYRAIWASTLDQALRHDWGGLSPDIVADAQPCTDFNERTIATARTYQSRPEATGLIPAGTVRDDINYSTEKKRILNSNPTVSSTDNVKQHKYTHEVL